MPDLLGWDDSDVSEYADQVAGYLDSFDGERPPTNTQLLAIIAAALLRIAHQLESIDSTLSMIGSD